jgi:flagellar biogenesis protein FliO
MVLKIKDKEIVIANTEHGISLLTQLESCGKPEVFDANSAQKKSMQIFEPTQSKESKEIPIKNLSEIDPKQNLSFKEKKSDILIQALKKMEKNSSIELNEEARNNEQSTPESSARFPKYFSNAFELESNKDIKKKDETDSIENVTSLIREKLRSMKPLN